MMPQSSDRHVSCISNGRRMRDAAAASGVAALPKCSRAAKKAPVGTGGRSDQNSSETDYSSSADPTASTFNSIAISVRSLSVAPSSSSVS